MEKNRAILINLILAIILTLGIVFLIFNIDSIQMFLNLRSWLTETTPIQGMEIAKKMGYMTFEGAFHYFDKLLLSGTGMLFIGVAVGCCIGRLIERNGHNT